MRERRVTRTIKALSVKALYCDTENQTATEKEVVCPNLKGNKLDAYLKATSTATEKFVCVNSVTETESIYAMSEADFIKHATVIEKR